ncbi:hypothetical protein GCM10009733_021060 [Nonomuraea maheshkhaliensis]|uniref:Uncharacterized protein n=1 Tax=Nonomuraea maheshkhaliensis TaxID=419590 RepID=A0ABP4QW56_9ACTN
MRDHISYDPATAPAPIIATPTPGKPLLRLSGIVFGWLGRCIHCRTDAALFTEDGDILVELEGSGSKARWSRRHLVKCPEVPRKCPRCGAAKWCYAGSFQKPTRESPRFVGDAVTSALEAVFAQLRADYPEAARAADQQQRPESAYTTVVMG